MEEEFDLWSPAAAAAAAATAGGTAGASASATEQSWRSSTTALPGAAADDNDRETIKENHQSGEEMDRLKKEIKNLEQANAALREELVEARLETTALRHTSVELGEAVLDQEKRELGVEVKQGLRSGWSAPNILGKLWESDSDEAGAREDGREEASFPPPAMVVPGGTDTVESAAPVVPEARSDDDSQKEQVGQESVEKPNGSVSHTTRNDSDDGGVDRTEETPLEGAVPPESLLRRLSSSTFKDTEEQRELIEALRDQISQLQLEKQMRMAHTGKPNNTGGAESALGQYDGGAVKPSSCSKCSSDDDSGSGRDDTQGSPFGECQPRAWCSQYGEDGGSGDEDASRRRKQSGGDIENSVGRLDPAEHFILQERVSELSAELEAALKEVEALRGQARQNEAEGLELRVRELSAEVEAANKKTEALRELTKNQAQNLELRVCELSADLEAANRETEALREQAQRSQAQRLGLRVAELSAELETANKEMEALRDQARQSQAQRIGLRVDQVSAELETAYKTNDALRDQAQRSQAESVELQRELLRLQGTRDRASAVAAAVAAHSTYHGDGGESSERRSGCLDVNGFGWLRWLWIAVFCGEDRTKEEMGNRIEDSAHDDTLVEVGGELGNGINRRGSYRNGRQGRLAVDDRELLLNRDSRTMGR